MILGGAIRIVGKNLKESYWAQNKNGYQILDQNSHNEGIVLYCKVYNGIVVGGVEVYEDLATRDEKILTKFGVHKQIIKHYNL